MKLVGVEESTHEALKKYCKKNGLTMGEFVTHALAYFMSSGISPTSPPQSVKEELTKIEKRVSQGIAFQKTFERDRLNPLLSDLAEAVVMIRKSGNAATTEDVEIWANKLFHTLQEKAHKPQMDKIKKMEENIQTTEMKTLEELTSIKEQLNEMMGKLEEQLNKKGLFGR